MGARNRLLSRSRPAGAGRERRGMTAQQPPVHLPAASIFMVFPLNGRYTGTWAAALKAAVFVFGSSLPPLVAASLACDAITAFGLTSSLIT
jgi:hypothetical protein